MKILKYEKYGVGKYRIYLDNGEVIETYDGVILKDNLLLKKELTDKDYSHIFTETNLEELYRACAKYIGIRIRSTKEIKDYLYRKKINEQDIEEIIKRLEDNNLIDDKRFAEAFIKDKITFTSMGEYKIIAELKKHNISNSIIEEYSYLWDKEIMTPKIEKIVEKQIKTNKNKNKYQLRDKLYRYLINQGYSSDIVVSILNNKFE